MRLNDALRSDVGKVALCEFEVGIVMQDDETAGRRSATQEKIHDR